MMLRELTIADLTELTTPIDDDAYQIAQRIFDDVADRGEAAVREYAMKWDQLPEDGQLIYDRAELEHALNRIDEDRRAVLERTAERIRNFAQSQRDSFQDIEVPIPGGVAGHRWFPLQSAGCYAPGGNYPLPSSVLMTVVTARVAGVEEVWVASPNPGATTLAAAAIANADGVLAVGGAQAIAALGFGIPGMLPACDLICGPGNKYVTAAKAIVSRTKRIDMLAGPSELVVVAGYDADPELVAADLLAQAEHDCDARPILITNSADLLAGVQQEIERQLDDLPTAEIATHAIRAGGYLLVDCLEQAVDCCRKIAPEHLSLQGSEFESAAKQFQFGAALFIGGNTPEVFGDYGAGPNHVLPTGGSASRNSGLSVFDCMRFQTQLRIDCLDAASQLAQDAQQLGQLEGLHAHARSSALRIRKKKTENSSVAKTA